MDSEKEKIVGVLHDVVENTPVTLQILKEKGYSQEIVDAVDCLTKREGETYEDFIERCKQNPIALKVKIADLKDNVDIR
jgi:(p)ppGpp synthase/HD superfamily hydrolase